MEITSQQDGDVLTLKLQGRLDATWARHVSHVITQSIREGAHDIQLDLENVDYLSSAGIGVLLQAYKELQSLQGSFSVPHYSSAVHRVMELAGLTTILKGHSLPHQTPNKASSAKEPICSIENPLIQGEIHDLGEIPPMRGEKIGQSQPLTHQAFGPEHCHRIPFPSGSLGIGLGALGSDFQDCHKRFGEFLAVGGTATYLPSDDGLGTPDYVLSEGAFVPEALLLYGLVARGKFRYLLRFKSHQKEDRIGLAELASLALQTVQGHDAVITLIAETSSLVGATLQQSPVSPGVSSSLFTFPEIRDWFSFTTERAYAGSISLIVGFLSQQATSPMKEMLRPMQHPREPSPLWGHLHAATFPYRPLTKNKGELPEILHTLYEGQNIRGILHLLPDFRETIGVGESELIQGLCWIAPVLFPHSK